MNRKQHGFTLVEIAIVLVIIGLLLGGVLKGQEMINSAKVKNLANDFRSVPLFIYAYQDKFKRLPGDDPAAVSHLGATATAATTPAGKQGNGTIEGNWNSNSLTDENVLFWQHIRLAGLATGSTDFSDMTKAGLPANAEGGRVGLQMTPPPITGLSGNYYVCSSGINGKLAQQLDVSIDDGASNQGSLRALETGATDTNPAETYDNAKTYVLCQSF